MSLDVFASEKCLFLVCPTDCMEPILNKSSKEQAFFYTALGTYFEWDLTLQEGIISFISKRKIKQIIFVVKTSNRFFKSRINKRPSSEHFLVEKVLLKFKVVVPALLQGSGTSISKVSLLAAQFLEAQKQKLLDTALLGSLMERKGIQVRTVIFNVQKNTFLDAERMGRRIRFYENISMN